MDSRTAAIPEEKGNQIKAVNIDAITPPNLSPQYQNILAAMLSVLSCAVSQGHIALRTMKEVNDFVMFVEQQILHRTQLVFDYHYMVNGTELTIFIRIAPLHDTFGYTKQ